MPLVDIAEGIDAGTIDAGNPKASAQRKWTTAASTEHSKAVVPKDVLERGNIIVEATQI
jgi:flagella basal body P-ring formation protein FlgA